MTGGAKSVEYRNSKLIVDPANSDQSDRMTVKELLSPSYRRTSRGTAGFALVMVGKASPGIKGGEHVRIEGCARRVSAEGIIDSDEERSVYQRHRPAVCARGIKAARTVIPDLGGEQAEFEINDLLPLQICSWPCRLGVALCGRFGLKTQNFGNCLSRVGKVFAAID